jgi:hypothetical protein
VCCAALCHDCDHPGLTNGFLTRSAHPLARTATACCIASALHLRAPLTLCALRLLCLQVASHGAASTLERHHAAVALALLAAPGCAGVLSGLPAAAHARVLSLLPALIAATDIERNAAYVEAFTASQATQASAAADKDASDAASVARRDALLAMLLKVADVSNAAKAWPLALRWAQLLKAEHHLLGALALLDLPM